jgi:plastocyanin
MLKMRVILASVGALVFFAVATPSFAATVKVTDRDLQPATVTVKEGEVVTWVDTTTDRSAHVALEFGRQAGVQSMVAKDGGLKARFEKAGTYEYAAHVGIGGAAHPHEIRGKVVVK